MSQRSEFASFISVDIGMDWRIFKPDLGERAIRIAIGNLALASKSVMADSPDAAWFCLQVRPKTERDVEKALIRADVEAWVPCGEPYEFLRRGRHHACPGEPVLPGYVLVRCAALAEAFMGLKAIADVSGIVGGARRPWRISDEDINNFRELVADIGKCAGAVNGLHEGDMVAVRSGPFGKFEGLVVAINGARATVRISMFGHVHDIKMPIAILNKL